MRDSSIAALIGGGILVALAAAGARGSASKAIVENSVERPQFFYETAPKTIQDAIERVVQEGGGPICGKIDENKKPDILTKLAARMNRININTRLATKMRALGHAEDFIDTLYFQSMIDYVLCGKQSFIVGPKLQEMFEQTSIPRDVEDMAIRPPYDAFWIALPECKSKIWGSFETISTVRGVMVSIDPFTNMMSLLLWAPVGADFIKGTYANFTAKSLSPEQKKNLSHNLSHFGNDAYVTFNINEALSDPEGIESHIIRKWLQDVSEYGWPRKAVEETEAARVNILKIVFGTILYLQSDRKDLSPDAILESANAEQADLIARSSRLKSKAKQRKLGARMASLSAGPAATWLGRSIEETVDADESDSAATGPGRMRRRHWVRGHWRRPARKTGPRILRWIQPHQRGQGEDVTSRVYHIEDKP